MESELNYQQMEAALAAVTKHFGNMRPEWGLILGSGWGDALQNFTIKESLKYDRIEGLGPTQVAGHAGLLHLAEISGKSALVFQGRRHWYEGAGWTPVALPIYLMIKLKVNALLLTSAVGGLGYGFKVGDLMIIEDHINMMGSQILRGAHNPVWGERFPDMTAVYNRHWRETMLQAGLRVKEELRSGVLAANCGPQYETPAEVRMLRGLGVQAVGMSVVPEATLAHSAGIKVIGLSCITNLAAGVSPAPLSHTEVQEIGKNVAPRAARLFTQFFSMV